MIPPHLLLQAYAQGYFPMADETGTIYWYDPDPRAIFPLDERFHVPRRLARTMRQQPFRLTINRDFRGVIEGCAEREPSWINDAILESYIALHRLGLAHSMECWQGERLVGGIYGVALRGLFAGESMFSRVRDASKIALVSLVGHLRARGYTLFDVQFSNSHLEQFGVIELPRRHYRRLLAGALEHDPRFLEP